MAHYASRDYNIEDSNAGLQEVRTYMAPAQSASTQGLPSLQTVRLAGRAKERQAMTLLQTVREELARESTFGERLTFFLLLPVWWLDHKLSRGCGEFFFEGGRELVCNLQPNHQGNHAKL